MSTVATMMVLALCFTLATATPPVAKALRPAQVQHALATSAGSAEAMNKVQFATKMKRSQMQHNAKIAATQLLKILDMFSNTKENIPQEEFLPLCVEHVKQTVRTVDFSYTDEQLKPILEEQCLLDGSFPHVHENGFKHEQACREFAEQLVSARDQELETKSDKGYTEFCMDYIQHKTGGATQAKKSPKKEESGAPSRACMVAAFAVVFAVFGF